MVSFLVQRIAANHNIACHCGLRHEDDELQFTVMAPLYIPRLLAVSFLLPQDLYTTAYVQALTRWTQALNSHVLNPHVLNHG
jgi:hypothetical protein